MRAGFAAHILSCAPSLSVSEVAFRMIEFISCRVVFSGYGFRVCIRIWVQDVHQDLGSGCAQKQDALPAHRRVRCHYLFRRLASGYIFHNLSEGVFRIWVQGVHRSRTRGQYSVVCGVTICFGGGFQDYTFHNLSGGVFGMRVQGVHSREAGCAARAASCLLFFFVTLKPRVE